jgi:hypothetical protein
MRTSRLRSAIIASALATAALGALVLHGHSPEPQVALKAASAQAAPPTTEAPFHGVEVLAAAEPHTTATTVAEAHRAYPYPEPRLTPPTTTLVDTPPVTTAEVHYRHPDATLHSAHGTAEGVATTFCWKVSPTQSLCACGPGWADPDTSADADPGEKVTVSFDRSDAPREANWSISDSYDGDPMAHGQLDVNSLQVKVPTNPGRYWVQVRTVWPEGDILHVFKVNVVGTHAATDRGAILGAIDGDPDYSTLRLTGPAGRTIEITPQPDGRYRFNNIPAGTYELEATIESYPAYAEPGGPQVRTASRAERRTVDLQPGEIHREDFFADAK